MNACSERCSWCGRCEDDRTDVPPSRTYVTCDHCGGDAFYPVSVSWLGIYCSHVCANKASEKHATAMDQVRRG